MYYLYKSAYYQKKKRIMLDEIAQAILSSNVNVFFFWKEPRFLHIT